MRKRWIMLSLIIASMMPGNRVRAKPARKPEKKLTPREDAATEEAIFKLLAGLLQIGSGASEANLDLIERGPRDLARQRAAARREGIPLTPQEFQRPSPPPALNAAPIYEQLTRLLKTKPLDEKLEAAALRLGSHYQYGPEDAAAARKLLADRQDVMGLVHEATDRPQCVFRRDWSLGAELTFPEYSPVRAAARLLKVESYLLALDGRYPEAITNQARGFRLAAHIAPDGSLLAYLVAIACEAITLQGMQDILYRAEPNAAVAEKVRAAIEANRPTYSPRRTLEGDLMLDIGLMNECRRLGPQSLFLLSARRTQAEARRMAAPLEKTPAGRRLWKLLLDAGEADILSKMRRSLAIIQRPYPERKRLAQKWDTAITDHSTGAVGIFAAVTLPALGQVVPKAAAMHAWEEELIVGAEALAYRARNREWPERLEQMDPYLPIDPFTGRPLKYRRTPDGFDIYSLGESGRDDGDQVLPRTITAPEWKAVFRYPAPPPQLYPPPEAQPASPQPSGPAKS